MYFCINNTQFGIHITTKFGILSHFSVFITHSIYVTTSSVYINHRSAFIHCSVYNCIYEVLSHVFWDSLYITYMVQSTTYYLETPMIQSTGWTTEAIEDHEL